MKSTKKKNICLKCSTNNKTNNNVGVHLNLNIFIGDTRVNHTF